MADQIASRSAAEPAGARADLQHQWLLRVFGQIQDVGMRVFVADLARKLRLSGWVAREDAALFIQVQGPEPDLVSFLHCLRGEAPPRAAISRIQIDSRRLTKAQPPGFYVAPDRRRLQPVVTADLPDRVLCPACRTALFEAVLSPRPVFNNGCGICGPRLGSTLISPLEIWLEDGNGQLIAAGWEQALGEAVAKLDRGDLIMLPGWGEQYLAARADAPAAVTRLRRVTGRPHAPLLLLVRDVPQAAAVCEVSAAAATLLLSDVGPAVRLPRRPLADRCLGHIAPDSTRLDVLLPYHPALLLLLSQLEAPLALAPLPAGVRALANAYLVTNEPAGVQTSTSLVQLPDGGPVALDASGAQWLRRGRGFVPSWSDVVDPAICDAHAAVAAVMAEHQYGEPVLGLVFDHGTAGPDGHNWGGDLLVADRRTFMRTAQLEYVPRPPADSTPGAMAAIYLQTLLPEIDPRCLLPQLTPDSYAALSEWLLTADDPPLTCSAADLCTALVGLLDLADIITYPEQALNLLAAAAQNSQATGYYDTVLVMGEFCLAPLFAQILLDQEMGAAVGDIALRSIRSLAQFALTACQTIPSDRVNVVALAGTLWTEPRLLSLTVEALTAADYHVLWPQTVPAGPEGIAFGRDIITAARLAENEPR